MAVSVDIFVEDTEVVPQPIAGVVVNVYDASTLTLVASGTTDAAGQAALLLPGAVSPGTSYEVRFFKSGVIFENPNLIAVLEPVAPPDTNQFDFTGDVVSLPVATDPLMCRCTGRFIDLTGTPISNQLVKIQALMGAGAFTRPPTGPVVPPPAFVDPPLPPTLLSGFQVPKVLSGSMIASPAVDFRTDTLGKVSFDLPRGGHFSAIFAGEEDVMWCFQVPDRSSVNLIDLIHPEPSTLTWDPTEAPGDTATVAAGETIQVPFEVLFTNFRSYSKNLSNIFRFVNSDGSIAGVEYAAELGYLNISGTEAGTTTVTVEFLPELRPARIPDYELTYTPLSIVVTP